MFTIADTIKEMKENGEYPPAGITTEGLMPYLKRLGNDLRGVHINPGTGLSTYYLVTECQTIHHLIVWGYISEIARINIAEIKHIEINKTNIDDSNNPIDYFFFGGDAPIYECLKFYYTHLRSGGIIFGEYYSKHIDEITKFRQENKITIPIMRVTNDSWMWYKR